jgi:nanoRNase/pAp phosphatase (c-di-AMP/oligoRNAs hydrolase)
MDLTPKQQASEAVRQAESILIVTGTRPNIDQTASVVALSMILRKLGKKVSALITEQTPQSISFLTQGQIDRSLTGLRDFVIKVDLHSAEVDKLKYTIEDGKLNVHIMPFKGGFQSSDVTFSHGDYHYDLIIAVGVTSRSKLDPFFTANAGLLDSTPLLNLDYHRINENFGAINLVDTNSATLAEMLVSLSESLENGLIDEPIATALLAGIMAATDRFTGSNTTPKAMTVAAQLMAAGGKQQQIVKAVFGGSDRDRDRSDRNKPKQGSQPQASRPQQPQTTTQQPAQPAFVPAPEPRPYEPAQNPLETPQTQTTPEQPQAQVGPEPSPNEANQNDSNAAAFSFNQA